MASLLDGNRGRDIETQNIFKFLEQKKPRIYLAGPEVFLNNATEIGETKKALCKNYGFEGVFPSDNKIKQNKLCLKETGLKICFLNEQLIRGCQLLIANITPFRGPSADVGTAVEMGFARGIGLVVFAYTNVVVPFTQRTISILGSTDVRGEDGKIRDNRKMSIEEFDLADNLMIEGCVYGSGGILAINNAREDNLFTDLAGFKKCLTQAQNMFLG